MGYVVTDCTNRVICYIAPDGGNSILMNGVNVVETDSPIFTETEQGIFYLFENQDEIV